jgi:c(7)-type cytochrome triheme protein
MPGSIFPAERLAFVLAAWLVAGTALARDWLPLAKDGVHDPKSPAVRQLQEPRDALSVLPADTTGNMVRWVEALEKGAIEPRASIRPGTKVQILDQDILMSLKGGMPIVRFPHRQHTLWLDCSNCHEQLFKSQTGANKLSMFQILQGEQCGVCHGAVAFPLTECNRCHSVPRPNGRALSPAAPLPPHAKTGAK